MMKNLNLTFDDISFKSLKIKKENADLTWENYFLSLARVINAQEFKLRAKMVKDFEKDGKYDEKDLMRLNKFKEVKNGS